MKKVLIMGGQGNAGVIANAIADANKRGYCEYTCAGLLNPKDPVGTIIDSFPVVGNGIDDIQYFIDNDYYFINTVFRIDGQNERIARFENLNIPKDRMAIFVHPTAYVAPNVNLSPGCVVMPLVSISSNTTFGECCLIMVSATVGHDNFIGPFTHIAAQACVGAFLNVGKGCHIGLNATIREHLTLGNFSTIGMGAVLTKDVGEYEIWAGNPAKFLRMADK